MNDLLNVTSYLRLVSQVSSFRYKMFNKYIIGNIETRSPETP